MDTHPAMRVSLVSHTRQAPVCTRFEAYSAKHRRRACVCARNGGEPGSVHLRLQRWQVPPAAACELTGPSWRTGPAGKESTESLFVRELKRRGLETNQVSAGEEVAPTSAEAAQPLTTPQLAKSRALAYEGLEGLLPRAKELVKLGGSFFLGFGPLILLLVGLSAGTYAVRVSPRACEGLS